MEAASEAQIAAAQGALGDDGYLVILVDASTSRSLPSAVVDHEAADSDQVVRSHLAAKVAAGRNDTAGHRSQLTANDRNAANGLLEAARRVSAEARREDAGSSPSRGPAGSAMWR